MPAAAGVNACPGCTVFAVASVGVPVGSALGSVADRLAKLRVLNRLKISDAQFDVRPAADRRSASTITMSICWKPGP